MSSLRCFILVLLCGILIGIIMVIMIESSHPTAMDVYQGKTTLEYKMVDGVKTDSMVIFKNE